MVNSNFRTRTRGNCLIETIVGGMVLVPLGLFGLDALTLAITSSMNNHLAKDAARAAANQEDSQRASIAARAIVDGFRRSAIVTSVTLEEVRYEANKQVSVRTKLFVKLPAPFPFLSRATFAARATEPVVGVPVEFQEAS